MPARRAVQKCIAIYFSVAVEYCNTSLPEIYYCNGWVLKINSLTVAISSKNSFKAMFE
jgi:hypothetical protein